MGVLNYLEWPSLFARSGIGTATGQRRATLERLADERDRNLELVTDPWPDTLRTIPGRIVDGTPAIADYDVAYCNGIGPGSVVDDWANGSARPRAPTDSSKSEHDCTGGIAASVTSTGRRKLR